MKNQYILLLCGFTLLIGAAVGWVSSKDEGIHPQSKQRFVLAQTSSVEVPESVTFCGQEIALERYDMRERFDREINTFTYFHSSTMLMIKRANRYFPLIEPILKKYQVPDDFKYLAVIESMLEVRALSPAKAAGLWQFMAATGKEYGLEVSEQIDERYHVEKSTEAACKYLLNAYKEFGDWMDVAASYNAGIPRIKTELSRQQVNSFFDLLVVEETSRYVFRMMAIKQVFTHPHLYGFVLKRSDLYPPIRTKDVEITADVEDFALFAKEYEMDYFQLKNFNVWLRDRGLKTKGKTYTVQIPIKEDMYYTPSKVKVHNENWIVE